MKNKLKKIPSFRSEEAERAFWARHDSSEYIDWRKAKRVSFPALKPGTKSISIRLPLSLLERIKVAANRKDVPYQSYLKILLDERMKRSKEKANR